MKFGTLSFPALTKAAVWTAIFSSIVNVALAALGWAVSQPPTTFGPYQYSGVVGLTVAGVVAAAVVYAFVRAWVKDTKKANRYFVIISVMALIVSFYPDIMMPWSSDPDQVGWTYGIMANLMLMHVVAAGFVLYFFLKAGKRKV